MNPRRSRVRTSAGITTTGRNAWHYVKKNGRVSRRGHWTADVNVRDTNPAQHTQYEGDESFLARPHRGRRQALGQGPELQAGALQRRRARLLRDRGRLGPHRATAPATSTQPDSRTSKKVVGLPDRQAPERAFMPLRRHQMAQQAARELRLQDQLQVRPDLQRVPQDPQPGRL